MAMQRLVFKAAAPKTRNPLFLIARNLRASREPRRRVVRDEKSRDLLTRIRESGW